MKRLFFLLLIVIAAQDSNAQVNPSGNLYPKTISVNGTAEMEIVPDEIYINIELEEYQKRGENKKDLESIRNKFLEACKAAGIPDTAISIVAYSGNTNYYNMRKKKKDPDLMAGITYQVKFSNSKLIDELIQRLDDDATKNFQLAKLSHSRITDIRRELKIKAIQAAKEKAGYLAAAINEKAGEAISITEPGEWSVNPYAQYAYSNTMENVSMPDSGGGSQNVDFKKLKLSFTVATVFALK